MRLKTPIDCPDAPRQKDNGANASDNSFTFTNRSLIKQLRAQVPMRAAAVVLVRLSRDVYMDIAIAR